MNPLTTGTLLGQVADGLATDARSLDSLKRAARNDPKAALKQAATQFESLFMQMVLKSMRDAMPKSGLLDSSAQQMYTGMLDQQLAGRIAAGGTGLADVIARQLGRHVEVRSAGREVRADAARTGAANPAPAVGAEAAPFPTAPGADAKQAFVSKTWQHARAAEQATGVPARFIVGQAALESGWGQREIRTATGEPSHNLFGIKAGANWSGPTVEVSTTEFDNGVARRVVEKFRAYASYTEAFQDWGRLLADNPRYAGVLRDAGTASGFAHALQRAGYATDPAYGSKLAGAIAGVNAIQGKA